MGGRQDHFTALWYVTNHGHELNRQIRSIYVSWTPSDRASREPHAVHVLDMSTPQVDLMQAYTDLTTFSSPSDRGQPLNVLLVSASRQLAA